MGIALLVVGVPLGLFWIQNADTHVNLIFKITPELAWDLGPAGMSLPALLVLTFILGQFIAALIVGGLVFKGTRRVKTLERQVAALQDEIEFSRKTDAATVRDKAPAVDPIDDLL